MKDIPIPRDAVAWGHAGVRLWTLTYKSHELHVEKESLGDQAVIDEFRRTHDNVLSFAQGYGDMREPMTLIDNLILFDFEEPIGT
jgi:hypothetical protein